MSFSREIKKTKVFLDVFSVVYFQEGAERAKEQRGVFFNK